MGYDEATPAESANAWHHVYLAASAHAERERLKLMFECAYVRARKPRNMNLWMAPGAGGGADVYASPQAGPRIARLIARYRARPCAAPNRPVVLVAGYQHPTRRLRTRPLGVPGIDATERLYALVPYPCRCVRQLFSDTAPLSRYARWTMAPFVRRFADAWLISPALIEKDAPPDTRSIIGALVPDFPADNRRAFSSLSSPLRKAF